jgi:hypothetical protein
MLSEDIVLLYKVHIPEGVELGYMTFEFNGETFYVYEYEYEASSDRYIFRFPGINPQKMGDNICATVYAYVDGCEVSDTHASYSMVQYCDSQLKKATTSDATRTMLSDLLAYGEAAQIAQGYKTDVMLTSLLTPGTNLTPSTFPSELDESINVMRSSGEKDARVRFKSATLDLGAKVVVRYTVECTDISLFTYKLEVSGREYTYTGEDLVPTGTANVYTLDFDNVRASELGEVITATVWEGDTQVSTTIEYSVYTYIYRNYNKEGQTEATANLLKSIYNYGEAVKKVA